MKVQKLDGALATRASLRLKVTQIGTTMFFFPLVTLPLRGPEEALILVWRCLEGTSQVYVHTGFIVVKNILRVVHRHSDDKYFPQRS